MVGQFRRVAKGPELAHFRQGGFDFYIVEWRRWHQGVALLVDIRPIDSHTPGPGRYEHRIRDRPSVSHLDGDGRALAVSSQIFGRLRPDSHFINQRMDDRVVDLLLRGMIQPN